MALVFTRRRARKVLVPVLVPDTAEGIAKVTQAIAAKADQSEVAAVNAGLARVQEAVGQTAASAAAEADAKIKAAQDAQDAATEAKIEAASDAQAEAQAEAQAAALKASGDAQAQADEARRMAGNALRRNTELAADQATAAAALQRIEERQASMATIEDVDEMGAALTAMDVRQAGFETAQAGMGRTLATLAIRTWTLR